MLKQYTASIGLHNDAGMTPHVSSSMKAHKPMNPLRMKAWSPYLVGAGIGVLSWLTKSEKITAVSVANFQAEEFFAPAITVSRDSTEREI